MNSRALQNVNASSTSDFGLLGCGIPRLCARTATFRTNKLKPSFWIRQQDWSRCSRILDILVDNCDKNGLFQGHLIVGSFSTPLLLILNDYNKCSLPIHPDHTLIPRTSTLKIQAECSHDKVVSTEVILYYTIKDIWTGTFRKHFKCYIIRTITSHQRTANLTRTDCISDYTSMKTILLKLTTEFVATKFTPFCFRRLLTDRRLVMDRSLQ
jgi:hypothetical protein